MRTFKDITIQLNDNRRKFLHIYEGDGSNLSSSDIKQGYKDYVNVDLLEYDEGELYGSDGGIMLIETDFDEKYPKDNVEQLIRDSLEYIGYEDIPEYTIIQSNY